MTNMTFDPTMRTSTCYGFFKNRQFLKSSQYFDFKYEIRFKSCKGVYSYGILLDWFRSDFWSILCTESCRMWYSPGNDFIFYLSISDNLTFIGRSEGTYSRKCFILDYWRISCIIFGCRSFGLVNIDVPLRFRKAGSVWCGGAPETPWATCPWSSCFSRF